ncbi:hypothetical protein M9H77_20849 [Catharanthus roseus]|uniref:Uncharacterized protein n=1 Tax=Catharanthus roseus TaxID=4058 RepID=A0ACC0ALD5_CATRO|nr:hypothetical protein M9H77_20849 [Catharanthus roseus]
MGKLSQQQLPVLQPQRRGGSVEGVGSRIFCCRRCSIGLSRIAKEFNFKCLLVLLLTLALSVYALFSVLPLHSNQSVFDAKESIKLRATAQAYFRLQKPASELIPHISELEDEILGEIGVPPSKVAILSMHQPGGSNWTDVVFGVLPPLLNVSMDPVVLSLLKSTLVALYLEEANLTLSNTTFGQPFSFDILKFPGGLTLIPEQNSHFGEIPDIFFNFTLNNSIDEIKENFMALNKQLRFGLHLMPDENVYIQVTNKKGSTRDPPVVVEASITSDLGRMTLQRLRQLAEIIRGSSRKNLGLDNSVFGKVKEVILSSRFNHPAHALPPSPSPSPSRSPCSSPYPSPDSSWDTGPSVSPAPGSQSDPPSPVRFHHSAPCSHCHASTPASRQALAPSPNYHSPRPPSIPNTPAPSVMHNSSNRGHSSSPSSSPTSHTNRNLSPAASSLPPPKDPKSEMPLGPSPLPVVSYVSTHGQNNGKGRDPVSSPGVLPSISESSSSVLLSSTYKICWICLLELLMLNLL